MTDMQTSTRTVQIFFYFFFQADVMLLLTLRTNVLTWQYENNDDINGFFSVHFCSSLWGRKVGVDFGMDTPPKDQHHTQFIQLLHGQFNGTQ